jgi:hypothetical protein
VDVGVDGGDHRGCVVEVRTFVGRRAPRPTRHVEASGRRLADQHTTLVVADVSAVLVNVVPAEGLGARSQQQLGSQVFADHSAVPVGPVQATHGASTIASDDAARCQSCPNHDLGRDFRRWVDF